MNDIANLLRDKKGLIAYILKAIESSHKNAIGLRSMKERGWSQEGMLDKVIEITAIQADQIKHLALVALISVQSSDFDTDVAKMMMKMGRGDEALKMMFDKKLNGE